MEELRDEQDVIVCHHCHAKVHIVDMCNNNMAVAKGNDFDAAVEQMAGEELAMWMGVGDNLDAQQKQI